MAIATPAEATQDETAGTERLGVLFDKHQQRLYRLARRLSRNADDGRDLVQEVFLRAARAPGSVPVGDCREEAWLVRVLINICRDRWRQTAAKARVQVDHTVYQQRPADTEAALISRSMVQRALAQLPPRRRAVIVLHTLEGIEIPAIGRMLGVSAVTVRWHLSMGRRQLAKLLERDGGCKR